MTTTANKPRIRVDKLLAAIHDFSFGSGPTPEVFAKYDCLLFLDLDGVVHGFGRGHTKMFSNVEHIENVLRNNPKVGVVFSTSWRFNQSMDTLKGYFAYDLHDRFIGATPEVQEKFPPYVKHERFKECQKFMEMHGWTKGWVAIDDSKSLFPDNLENLVVTEGNVGMTVDDEKKLDAKLKLAIEKVNL